MIKNYFKIAIRNLLNNKVFSIINIAGLTVGMACTMLIFIWVYNEKSWDSNNAHYKHIYHVMSSRNFNGQITTGQDLMYPLAEASKASLPEVENAAVVSFPQTNLLTVGERKINKNILTASPDVFQIFTADFLYGNAAALQENDAIVLTKSTAMALYNSTNVIGKIVKVNNAADAIVTAVVNDMPRNATIKFDALLPFNTSSPFIKEAATDWVNCGNQIFFKVRPGANTALLETKVKQLIVSHVNADNPTTKGNILLHPMSKWRLYEEFKDGKNTGGRIQYVQLFSWIAFVILLIACINFMNLSTARSEKRAREVGIRKTLGSERIQLMRQFIVESLLLTVVSFLFAFVLVILIRPFFSSFLNEDIIIPIENPMLWGIVLAIILFTGLLAGSYPAFYLSAFNPVKVLKGSFVSGKRALLPRKIMVTAQFIVSVVLISATLIIYQQIQFVQSRDIGYDLNNLLMVNSSAQSDQNYTPLKNDLLQSGVVSAVSRSSSGLTTILGFTSGISWKGAREINNLVIGFLFANDDFVQTANVKMPAGRDFKAGDTNTVIFNEAAIKLMGLTNPVGKEITWAGKTRTIIGVIKNMVMESPYEAPSPLMVCYEPNWSGKINMRLSKATDMQKSIATIESIYKKHSASFPFEYSFVDDEFNAKFSNEKMIGKLAVIFSILAIIVCCLGLFGLVAFSIERRTKEIGMRKLLGSSVNQLLFLMSKEFLLMVLIAFIISIPVAWWLMVKWLQSFYYHAHINPLVFVLVGILLMLITLITVGLNAWKAALMQPVKSLQS